MNKKTRKEKLPIHLTAGKRRNAQPRGQKGHKGTTQTKSDMEEKIKSGKCRHEIKNIGKIFGDTYITKYVLDLSVIPVITEIRIYPDEKGHFSIPAEYRSDVTYGADVKSLAVALYSEGVMSNDRIAVFLNAAGSDELDLLEGSVYGFCKKFAGNARMSIDHLENELLNQTVVATDATTVTVNGGQNYIRNFSTKNTVTTTFFSCITLRSCLMIIFRNVILGKPKTVRRWQVVSRRTVDMKCTAQF